MKHVVVTGGTKGIGYGLAKGLLLAGCKVTICGRNEDTLIKAKDTLANETKNFNIHGIVCDVTDYEALNNLFVEARSFLGDIDIWINNAGIDQKRKPLWLMTQEEMDKIVAINIKGVMYGTAIAVENMLAQGKGIVYNMEGFGSDGAMRPLISLYGTTKRTVRYYSRAMAKELKGKPVKVCRLSPGMVLTDFLKNGLPEEETEKVKAQRIFAILADEVEEVTGYLVPRLLKNSKNGALIAWLTKPKIFLRFLTSKSRIKKYETRYGVSLSKSAKKRDNFAVEQEEKTIKAITKHNDSEEEPQDQKQVEGE